MPNPLANISKLKNKKIVGIIVGTNFMEGSVGWLFILGKNLISKKTNSINVTTVNQKSRINCGIKWSVSSPVDTIEKISKVDRFPVNAKYSASIKLSIIMINTEIINSHLIIC